MGEAVHVKRRHYHQLAGFRRQATFKVNVPYLTLNSTTKAKLNLPTHLVLAPMPSHLFSFEAEEAFFFSLLGPALSSFHV
jgi:hypothetical protein